jgi:tetratricopeptide (TPR) repeat protein
VPRRAWATYAVFLAMAAAATLAAFATSQGAGFVPGTGADSDAGLAVRGLLACSYYLENYLAPVRLAAWSPPPVGVSMTSGAAVLSLVECAAFVAILLLARRFSRTAFLGLVLFAIVLAPFLAASAGRRLLAADRYMYLPIFGLHLALAGTAVQVGDALRRSVAARPLLRRLAFAPVAALLCYWLVTARGLAPSWADAVNRDARVVEVYPQSVLAHGELAKAHLFEHQPDAALRVIAEARQRLGDHPRLAANAGEAYRQKRDWPRALVELRAAAAGMPDHVRTQYYYALTLEQVGERDEARRLLRHICAVHETFHPAAAALARSYTASGEIDAAIAAWRTALDRKPFDRDSAYELSLLLLARGEAAEAERLLRGILSLNPDDRVARFHLAVALTSQGRMAEALDYYDRLIAEDADDIAVRLNRAAVLVARGRADEAETDYRAVLERAPNQFDAAVALHKLLFRANRLKDILSLWTEFPDSGPRSLACTAWAYALNNRIETARVLIAGIPSGTPARAAGNWAMVYDALLRRADDDLQAGLGEVRGGHLQEIEPQIRNLIASALAALPEPVRNSSAGRYTLARWLHATGDGANARVAARWLVDTSPPDRWTRAAARLLIAMDEPGASPPSCRP